MSTSEGGPRRVGHAVAGTLTLASLVLTGGCARTVAVIDPQPAADAAPVCAAVIADLPARVLDQDRRTVTPGRYSAAWGTPPVVLRCGGPAPPTLTSSSECLDANGVGWFAEPAQGGTIFTTIGRAVFVEVAVPTDYAPESGALVDVAATVAAHDPVRQPCV